jgi:hypothetical protein
MDQSAQYGQMDFNLPHDVVSLPSKGIFYRPKKESLKVGFLTASDENLLMAQNTPKEGLINTLLRNKIYEPGFDIGQLLDSDAQAILIFLRNTSFGSEYNVTLVDPLTNKTFDATILLEELNFNQITQTPNNEGYFSYFLKKSKKNVKCKLLTLSDLNIIEKLKDSYPNGMVVPLITKRLEMAIVDIEGEKDRQIISNFINQMPISDSKDLRKFLKECEPSIDLTRTVTAPSGEKVTFELSFGVEFFRPFFSI